MDWHIITSSKGGVGKTLLSLLLLAYHLEEKKDGSTLFLDLNGVNTDSMAMLVYRKPSDKKSILLKTNETIYQNGFEQIQLQKSYTFDSKQQQCNYIVGYPLNPFALCNPKLFADLLISVKNEAPTKIREMGLPPLKYVIIDTNYHFCNIFGNDEFYYTEYQDSLLKNDNFNIWFLWVYRQLEKIISSEGNTNETKILRATASCIENNLTNKITPFKHVFNPVALTNSQYKEGKLTGTLKSLFNAMLRQNDYLIPEFNSLEQLPKGKNVDFELWVDALVRASNSIETFQDRSLSFLPILVCAVKSIDSKQRPSNIIPLSIYQPTLRQYTDKDRGDIVAIVRNMKIYKHFSNLMR